MNTLRIGKFLVVVAAVLFGNVHAGQVLYVSEGNSILKFDPGPGFTVFATGLSSPQGLAYRDGYLYATNNGNTILRFDSGGNASLFSNSPLINQAQQIAFDSTGNLYVANNSTGTVAKIDPSGNATLFASGLNGPIGIAVDASGNVYVTNAQSDSITEFNPAGAGHVFAHSGSYPAGLAVDAGGNIYVADANSNTLSKFNSSGTLVFASGAGLSSPVGLVIDSGGNVFVSNSLNAGPQNIVEFDPAGNESTFAPASYLGASPHFLALQTETVPEPATLALLMLGLVGLRARRRGVA